MRLSRRARAGAGGIRAAWLALALALVPACVDKPTEHRVRANAFLRAGDADAALAEIERGLTQDDDNLALLILKGKALFELERYDEAKAAYEAAVRAGAGADKELGEAHLGLAIIALRESRYAEARQSFEKLVTINGDDADARMNLARICLQLGDLECAVKHGEEAGHLRGQSEDVLFTLGRIYVTAKKYDEAEKTFNHICQVVPKAASCPYGVALVAAQRGDHERALAKLKEAIDRKLPNPDQLAADPMLAPIKDNPAFAKLVAQATGG
jgi:tetratricopeptide (TPR) repeat protein